VEEGCKNQRSARQGLRSENADEEKIVGGGGGSSWEKSIGAGRGRVRVKEGKVEEKERQEKITPETLDEIGAVSRAAGRQKKRGSGKSREEAATGKQVGLWGKGKKGRVGVLWKDHDPHRKVSKKVWRARGT